MRSLRAPLAGVKVIDFTRQYLNYAGLLLADLGANVTKVEDLASPDPLHTWFPLHGQASSYYYLLCRNKRTVNLNFRSDMGRSLLRRLATKADILLENTRPGTMARLGLDYPTLSKQNPSLIYCSISCFGQKCAKPGHAINCMAKSGLLSYSGTDSTPSLAGGLGADMSAVLFANMGLLAALYRRTNDPAKRGEKVEVAMAETMMAKNMLDFGKLSVDSRAVPVGGKELSNGGFACYNVYKTKDGKYIAVGATDKRYWDRLCNLLGIGKSKERENFFEPGPGQEMLKSLVGQRIAAKTASEWEKAFSSCECCCNVVKDLKEAVDDPDYSSGQDAVLQHANVAGKDMKFIRLPVRMTNTKTTLYREAECAGESTEKILAEELGVGPEELAELRRGGAIPEEGKHK